MIVFDYMFYRLAKFFYKRDGSLAPRAIAIVTLTQVLSIAIVLTLIVRLFFDLDQTAIHAKDAGKIGGVAGIVGLVLNYIRYRKGYSKLSDRWRNAETSEQRRLRGFLVFLGILLPIALMIFLGTSSYR
jgi:hypothetical protein